MPRVLIFALVCGLLGCAGLVMAEGQDIKALLKAAGADGEPARLRAIDTLGEQSEPAPEVIKTLSEQLQDSSAMVRTHAAQALGRLGPAARPAVEVLAPLVADPDAKVRHAATRAWIQIRPGPKVTVPLLTKVLKDVDPAVRTTALEIVTEMGKPAVPALIEALKNEKSTYWVCLALAEIGPSAAEAAPALADSLKTDARPEVRREAALALGKIGSAAITAKPELRKKLTDKDQTVALAAALALAQIDPQCTETGLELVPLLIEGLSDPGPRTRLQAAVALRCLGPLAKKATPALTAALRDKDELVRDMAAQALKAIGE